MTRLAPSARAAAAAVSLLALSTPAMADDEAPGWGVAVAAKVIGERCRGALESDELSELNSYITASFKASVEKSTQSPQWWADLRDKLEASYVEKYSDPANCTEEARDEAEELASDVHDHMERTVR